jgi:tetratricopeptide (TPR) repeat protein
MRFDVEALRRLAGEAVFGRGQAYHRDGRVEILSVDGTRARALVAGTEDYRTDVSGQGAAIRGACSCRAFCDHGFCKHMVATALAVNAAEAGGAESVNALEPIRAHLRAQGIDALVEMIIGFAGRDPDLFRRLGRAASLAGVDDETLELRLRETVDAATGTDSPFRYDTLFDWVADVDAALDELASFAPSHGALVLDLAERVVDNIETALEDIDDSEGEVADLLGRAVQVHRAAASAAQPEPIAFAAALFEREIEGEFDTFSDAADLYADVLGAAGLAEYRRLAMEAWQRLPVRNPRKEGFSESDGLRRQLARILDIFAEREGDVDFRIALRAKDLSSPGSYHQFASFCLSQGRTDEALRRVEEALWLFEDARPNHGLVCLAADLLVKAGRSDDALGHLWRAFERIPSRELYAQLRAAGGDGIQGRIVQSLERWLAKEPAPGLTIAADLLVEALLAGERRDEAWAAAHRHRMRPGVLEKLAAATEVTHPREAEAVYADAVETRALQGGEQAYAEAAALVARLARLRSEAEQTSYLADLRQRHGRRRNLMKLLG